MKLFNKLIANSNKSSFTSSYSTLKVFFILIAVFGVYFFTIHPFVVKAVEEQLTSIVVSTSSESTSQLSPIGDSNNEYQSEYLSYTLRSQPSYITNDIESLIVTDARVIAMRDFLIDYSSPMYKDAEVFIEVADETGLDWRLVASISGVESAFGRLIPAGSYNGWGWKGDPTRDWSYFGSWENGITTVTEGLAYGYGTNLTPFDIEPTYCPPCGLNPEHAWANGVTNYMYELSYYLEQVEAD